MRLPAGLCVYGRGNYCVGDDEATETEDVTPDWVQAALTVMTRALSIPEVTACIEDLETICKLQSPFDSVTKLHQIVKRGRDRADIITWIFQTIRDKISSKAMCGKDFALRALMGEGGGGRGLIDLYIMKFEMKRYLLTYTMDKLEIPAEVKEPFAKALENHVAYRQMLNPIPLSATDDTRTSERQAPAVDLSWRRGWKRSAVQFLSFCEDVIYGDAFDGPLRTATRAGKAPPDVVEYDSFKNKIKELHTTRQKEVEEDRKAALPAGEDSAGADAAAGTGTAAADGSGAAEDDEDDLTKESSSDPVTREAIRTVNANVSLSVEPDSQTEIKAALQSSSLGRLFGEDHRGYPFSRSNQHSVDVHLPLADLVRTSAPLQAFGGTCKFVCITYMYVWRAKRARH